MSFNSNASNMYDENEMTRKTKEMKIKTIGTLFEEIEIPEFIFHANKYGLNPNKDVREFYMVLNQEGGVDKLSGLNEEGKLKMKNFVEMVQNSNL